MVTHLGHLGIKTSDLEKSVAFYRDVLGLKEAFRMGRDGQDFIVYMYVSPHEFIELFAGGKVPAEYADDKIGFMHICLEVDDVEAEYKRMRELGVELDTGILDGYAKCRQFWIHDPDGTPIEMMELPPESLQARAIARLSAE